MKRVLKNTIKFILFLSTGLVILWLVYRKQNAAYQEQCALDGIPADDCVLYEKVLSDFAQANYFWIGLVILAFVISNLSRAARWNMLLRPLGYRPGFGNAFWTIMLGYFANLGLPRLGEVLRPASMARYEKIPVEKVMGTVVTDRLVDMACLLLIVALAFLLAFNRLWEALSANVGQNPLRSPWLWIITSLGLLSLVLVWRFWHKLQRFSLVQKITSLIVGFMEGLQTIRRMESPWKFAFHTVVIWCMYFLMTYLAFFAFAPTAHLGPLAGLVVFVFGAFGIVIPSPGGMGTYHFLVIQALAIYGISELEAFSFANIAFFSINLFCNVGLGIISLIALPLINRNPSETASLAQTPENS